MPKSSEDVNNKQIVGLSKNSTKSCFLINCSRVKVKVSVRDSFLKHKT